MNRNIHLIHYVYQPGQGRPTKRLSHVGEVGLCDTNELMGPVTRLLGALQGQPFMSHKVEMAGGVGCLGISPYDRRGAEGDPAQVLRNFSGNFLGNR